MRKRETGPKKSGRMHKVEGLWVHQGTAAPDADAARVPDDVREERLATVLKARPLRHAATKKKQ